MRGWTITELMYFTRFDLCELRRRIENQLPIFPIGSIELANADESLRNIRMALARRDFGSSVRQ
jgi:hypothetical protein